MTDDAELMIKHRAKIVWVQQADAKALAKLFEDFEEAQRRLKIIHALLQDPSSGHYLPPRQHEALLHAWDGLGYDEIGEKMGIQRQSVPKQLQAALRKLDIADKPSLHFIIMQRIREALEGIYIGPAIGIEFPIFIEGYGEISDMGAWQRFCEQAKTQKYHSLAMKEALTVE